MLTFKESGLKDIFDYLKNFGFKNDVEVVMPGTNAKMNEFQSLMGSLVLKYLKDVIGRRAVINELYRRRLKEIPGILLPPPPSPDITQNYSYMPIEIDENEFGMSRNDLHNKLFKYNIQARRYFYPLLCDYACYRSISLNAPLTVARRVAERILTLPLYDDLQPSEVDRICEILSYFQANKG